MRGLVKLFWGKDPNLIGVWSFENGLATDYSGSGLHGTISGAIVSEGCPYIKGNGMKFDGVNDYIQSGFPSFLAGNRPFTVMFWANPHNLPAATNWIFAMGTSSSNQGYHIGFYGTNPQNLAIGFWGYGLVTNKVLRINRWYYVAVTYNGSNTQVIYLDAIPTFYGLNGASPNLTAGSIFMGRQLPPYGEYFNGIIDEIALFSRALSPEEIRDYYKWTTSNRKYFIGGIFQSVRRRLLLSQP